MMRGKRIIYFCVGIVIVGLIAAYYAKPVYGWFKGVRATIIADAAYANYLTDPENPVVVRNSINEAKSALILSSSNYSANRTLASLLTFAEPRVALQYWEQAESLWRGSDRMPIGDQMAMIQNLIILGQLERAFEILTELPDIPEHQGDINYNLAKISYLRGDKDLSVEYSRKMVRDKHTPLRRHLFFIQLLIETGDSDHIQEGLKHLRFLIENDDLIDDSILWEMTEIAGVDSETLNLLTEKLGVRMVEFREKLDFASYEVGAGLVSMGEAFRRLKSEMPQTPEASADLAKWCSDHGYVQEVFELLPEATAFTRRDWFLVYLTNLGRLDRWDHVVQLLDKPRAPIESFWAQVIKAEAYDALGERSKCVNAWYRARLELYPEIRDTWLLIRAGDRYDLETETKGMLKNLVFLGEDLDKIITYLVERDFNAGEYDQFYFYLETFKETYSMQPDVVNDWAYYSILLDRKLGEAKLEVNRLIENNPERLRYHMTWALAKIKLGEYRDVLARFQQFDINWMELHPKWRFILAMALAGVGEFEQAEAYLDDIEITKFNPFEIQLYEKLMLKSVS